MTEIRRAPSLRFDEAGPSLYSENRMEWTCPACGVYGTVEAINDVENATEAIKTHHDLVSPQCLNSRLTRDALVEPTASPQQPSE